MITEERIIEVLKSGCPKCGSFDLFVDSTELVRRNVSLYTLPGGMSSIEWDTSDFVDSQSDDYIVCRECLWQEPEE